MKLTKDAYTVKEVAQLLNLDPQAIRAAIRAGTLKAGKFSNSYFIRRADFADYLEYRKGRDNGE